MSTENQNERVESVLVQDETGGNDYTMKTGWGSVWITVNNISVRIKDDDEGVVVELYPRTREAESPLSECFALYSDSAADGGRSKEEDEQNTL